MATKDGDKRRTSRASPQTPAADAETPARRGAKKSETPTRQPRARAESASASAPPISRRRTEKAASAEVMKEPPAFLVEATAEADLPVTQAAVTTDAEPAEVERAAAASPTSSTEPPTGLPEELGDDLAEMPATAIGDDEDAGEPEVTLDRRIDGEQIESASSSQPRWMRRERMPHGNALGMLIERQFSAPGSPCRSYSDLERRSGISREALSRYVTTRPDRRRSPTIDTLVAVADAMHLSLDATCRAAAATAKGTVLASPEAQRERDEVVSALIGGLSDDQFSAVVELLRQMRPAGAV